MLIQAKRNKGPMAKSPSITSIKGKRGNLGNKKQRKADSRDSSLNSSSSSWNESQDREKANELFKQVAKLEKTP
jgi:hypothetical protein